MRYTIILPKKHFREVSQSEYVNDNGNDYIGPEGSDSRQISVFEYVLIPQALISFGERRTDRRSAKHPSHRVAF